MPASAEQRSWSSTNSSHPKPSTEWLPTSSGARRPGNGSHRTRGNDPGQCRPDDASSAVQSSWSRIVADGHSSSASRAAAHSGCGGFSSRTLTNPPSSSRFANALGARRPQVPDALHVVGLMRSHQFLQGGKIRTRRPREEVMLDLVLEAPLEEVHMRSSPDVARHADLASQEVDIGVVRERSASRCGSARTPRRAESRTRRPAPARTRWPSAAGARRTAAPASRTRGCPRRGSPSSGTSRSCR